MVTKIAREGVRLQPREGKGEGAATASLNVGQQENANQDYCFSAHCDTQNENWIQ